VAEQSASQREDWLAVELQLASPDLAALQEQFAAESSVASPVAACAPAAELLPAFHGPAVALESAA
jgi:hypothetical protein